MNYFQSIPMFSEMTEQDQESLSDFCQSQTLSPWEILFREGDEPQALYIIASGELFIEKSMNGENQTIATLWFGEMVGEMAFFWEPPLRNASVRAKTEVKLIVILHFSMRSMLEKYPKLHMHFRSIIEEREQKNAHI